MLTEGEEKAACPFCFSEAITIGPVVMMEDPPYRDCICQECSKPWRDILSLVVVDTIPR